MVLKMWPPGWQQQQHLGTCKKCTFSDPTPRPAESETLGPAALFFFFFFYTYAECDIVVTILRLIVTDIFKVFEY